MILKSFLLFSTHREVKS